MILRAKVIKEQKAVTAGFQAKTLTGIFNR